MEYERPGGSGSGRKAKFLGLHNLIFFGMGLGVLIGIALGTLDHGGKTYGVVFWLLDLFGRTFFMGALKMIIAPLILASIVSGVVSLREVGALGRIGGRIAAYYVGTTCVAVLIGLLLVLVIQPGRRSASLELRARRRAYLSKRESEFERETGNSARRGEAFTESFRRWIYEKESVELAAEDRGKRWEKLEAARRATPGRMFKESILKPMLENPFSSLAGGSSLGIITFSLLLGIALVATGEKARSTADFFVGLNAAIMTITRWIMAAAPFCVMCIVGALVAEHGLRVFASLSWYCATVIAGIVCHVAFLFTLSAVLARIGPRTLWRGVREAFLIAFATRSSAATLPVTLRCVTEKLRISPRIANFTLPVGATMNMDGTALYEGVAVIFLLQIYGGLADVPVLLGGMVTFLVFITAVLASVGAAAVPDAGLVTMVLVANAVGLPVYYIPLIFAVDAFLDMFRTSTNVLGDIVGCAVVAGRGSRGSPSRKGERCGH